MAFSSDFDIRQTEAIKKYGSNDKTYRALAKAGKIRDTRKAKSIYYCSRELEQLKAENPLIFVPLSECKRDLTGQIVKILAELQIFWEMTDIENTHLLTGIEETINRFLKAKGIE